MSQLHLPHSFTLKKSKILSQLSLPISEYDDLSPKGSIDVGIRELIDEINGFEGFVTTSSCAGRVSVYLEGVKALGANDGVREDDDREAEGEGKAGVGGKGGGRWLFVSHDPIANIETGSYLDLMGLKPVSDGDSVSLSTTLKKESRLIHFKFEPMILHVLTSSLIHSQLILSAALQAGFRESGALNLLGEPATPMVGIRSMGLALESIIGFEVEGELKSLTPEWQLKHLVEVSNERFKENEKRIERFRVLLKEMTSGKENADGRRKGQEGDEWEDKNVRRERKAAEGRARAEAVRKAKGEDRSSGAKENVPNIGSLAM